jgi:hypothetical protein
VTKVCGSLTWIGVWILQRCVVLQVMLLLEVVVRIDSAGVKRCCRNEVALLIKVEHL